MMAATEQTEEKAYDRYGNLVVKRVLGDDNEDIKYDKFSLYNMTSSYLKKLPATEKKEQIRAMIKLRQLIADKQSLEKVPTLEMIHKAIEMKQLLKMADEKFAKIYQEPYFMDTDSGVYHYFDMDQVDYQATRKIYKLSTEKVMYLPVELASQDGQYNIQTIRLPDPESKLMGKVDQSKYLVMWHLIGFYEYPEMEPCVKQFEGKVLMIGSGKIALARQQHKLKWQKDNTLAPFNDQVVLMGKISKTSLSIQCMIQVTCLIRFKKAYIQNGT